MAIDMSQFYQVFFEESAEHLATMESLLLGLDVGNPDPEELNAIFRAAHSIKGSAGTFGFTGLSETTHILENLLDRIRKQELELRADMVDAFLEAGDLLKSMLAAHQGQGAVDGAVAEALRQRLRRLSAGGEVPVAPPVTAADPPPGCAARSAAGNSRLRHPIRSDGRLGCRGWGHPFRRRPEALGYVGGARKTRSRGRSGWFLALASDHRGRSGCIRGATRFHR